MPPSVVCGACQQQAPPGNMWLIRVTKPAFGDICRQTFWDADG